MKVRERDGIHEYRDACLEGWYAVEGRKVILSFIVSLDPGKGRVAPLLADWKKDYDTIVVPTPSARMRGMCERRGFRSEMVWMPEFETSGDCMVWHR